MFTGKDWKTDELESFSGKPERRGRNVVNREERYSFAPLYSEYRTGRVVSSGDFFFAMKQIGRSGG
jgi:hypothetical protein